MNVLQVLIDCARERAANLRANHSPELFPAVITEAHGLEVAASLAEHALSAIGMARVEPKDDGN